MLKRTNHVSILLVSSLLLLPSCQSGPPRPARISHIVFITLDDPARAGALIAECDDKLPSIPGVVSYACGRHINAGRTTVDSNYDVGLYIGFDSINAYNAYVEHPNHVSLVEQWKPSITSMLVRDVLDDSE